MPLPINIKDLINGQTIESERIEFKRGWNPEEIIHSICAFANDFHGWGGGYIIIGIDEAHGQPILPPTGLRQNQLDSIQREIIQLGHRLSPHYFPITSPFVLDGRHILVLWCPAGDNRVYDAPSTLGQNAQRRAYIRIGSASIIAQGDKLRKLQELTARIPYDDRINNRATINDLDLGLIREYLQEIKSDLFEASASMSFNDLCRAMLIAKGPDEDLRPCNVGLFFFCKDPQQFFDRSRIEIVWHQDDSGKNFKEYLFAGPIHKQLRKALSFIKTNIISEQIEKLPDQAEAIRYSNFPYAAIEEALSNAVYHKSYELADPIEVQVHPDCMTVQSHPGPVPPVDAQILASQQRIIARNYRNRRIGDFLKELRLTEGRGTGLPAIYSAMARNGSPDPIFATDDLSYFLVTIPIRLSQQTNGATNGVKSLLFRGLDDLIAFANGATNGATTGAGQPASSIIDEAIHSKVVDLLKHSVDWINRGDLFDKLGLSNQSANRKKYLDPVFNHGWLRLEFPDNMTHPKQRYKITAAGQRILAVLSN